MNTEMRVYISLPITGQEAEAREKADMVKGSLSRQGFKVTSPFEIYPGKNPVYADYICHDLRAMVDHDAVYFCAGWEESRGCRIEHFVASEFGLKRIYEEKNSCSTGL